MMDAVLKSRFAEFVDDCLQRARYSKYELDLLYKLLSALPRDEEVYQSFFQSVYLDRLELGKYGKSAFELHSVSKYIKLELEKAAFAWAKDAFKIFKDGDGLDEKMLEVIRLSLAINGEGEQVLRDLQKYFYKDFTEGIKELLG